MEVRKATASDIEEIIDVCIQAITTSCRADHKDKPEVLSAWLENKTPEQVLKWIFDPDYFLIVAEEKTKIWGVALISVQGYLSLTYVLPSIQNRGIGKKLLGAAEGYATNRGCNMVTLESTKTAIMITREMRIADHDMLIDLFSNTPGVTVREADSREATEYYLERNPQLNFVAIDNDQIVGCVMCGHDGRRGYLQHLIVRDDYRRQGIGQRLFLMCTNSLAKIRILKTHIFVFRNNDLANSFWSKNGWYLRQDINMYSYNTSSNPNA